MARSRYWKVVPNEYVLSRLEPKPPQELPLPQSQRLQVLSEDQHAKLSSLRLLEGLVAREHRRNVFEDDDDGLYYYIDGRQYDVGELETYAPEHHPRRCHARRKKARCARWSINGMLFCVDHLHEERAWPKHIRQLTKAQERGDELPSYYARTCFPALAKRLNDVLGSKERAHALLLYDEIALGRVFVMDALAMYEASCSSDNADPALRIGAAQLVREATDHVADLVVKCAQVHRVMADAAPLTSLGSFVEDVARTVHKVLEQHGIESQATVEELAEEIRGRARIPGADQLGADPRVVLQLTYDDVPDR